MNQILRKYFYELEFNRHEISIKVRIKPLQAYFSFLAEGFNLGSEEDITDEHIEKTNIETIRKYQSKLEEMNYTVKTIREKLIFVKSFYTFYIEETSDRIPMKHPFKNFRLPSKTPKTMPLFEPQYYIDFISHIDGSMMLRNQSIAAILVTTGIKLKDLCDLKMSDIIFDANEDPVEINTGSTRIPLNKAVKLILKNYLKKERADANSTYVFTSRDGNGMHITTIQQMLRLKAEAQNLDRDSLTPQALKKCAISTYRRCGGGDTGLRDFFGKSITGLSCPTTNDMPFFDNPIINGLYDFFVSTDSQIDEDPFEGRALEESMIIDF